MKKICFALICSLIFLSGCAGAGHVDTELSVSEEDTTTKTPETNALRKGDTFSVTGVVDYSDEPSDIGLEYCFITGKEKMEYYFIDIYDQESKWASNVFYTQGDDTALLQDYVGQELTVSGAFDAECHGIPYITNITILTD